MTVPATIQVDEVSYRLPVDASFEQWMEHGRTLLGIMRAVSWWVGDWIIAGEERFGEVYAQAIDLTGLSESALRQAAWVASRIPPESRRPGLSFAHHRGVAALEPAERDALLDIAQEQQMTSRELVAMTKARKQRQNAVSSPEIVEERADEIVEERAGLPGIVARAIRLLEQAQDTNDWMLVDDAIRLLQDGLPGMPSTV